MQLSDSDMESKLSPWLANGSLSVRNLYFTVIKYQNDSPDSESIQNFLY